MKDSLFSDLPGSSEPEGPRSRKWLMYVAVAVGVLIAITVPVMVFGPSRSSSQNEDEELDPAEVAKAEERRLLGNVAQDAISPAQLGDTVTEPYVTEELNRWWSLYGPGAGDSDVFGESHGGPLKELLGDEFAALAMSDSFSRKDVAHLTSSKSLFTAGLTINTGLETDHQRVMAAFYFVVRNIQLVNEGASQFGAAAQPLPATFPYQTLMWGRGRAEDRIWTFIELLRQIRIDAFLIVPSADSESGHPLVVAATADGLLLFDPAWGLPIPSLRESEDSALPMVAATYIEALGDDEVFRQLDGPETPYPWSAEALRDVQLLVVGSDSVFAPRMEALQGKLADRFSFIMFDGWSSNEFREAALQERIEAAVAPLEDVEYTIAAWSYPFEQGVKYDAEEGLEGPSLAARIVALQVPKVSNPAVEQNPSSDPYVTATNSLQERRADHIHAEFAEAMRGYLPIRSADQPNFLPGGTILSDNREAAHLADFWSAICQFETGYERLSITSFQQYLREHASGQFTPSATYWLAVAQSIDGQTEAALETLNDEALTGFPPGHLDYLRNRWSTMQAEAPATEEDAAPSADEAESSDAATPET